MKRKMVHLLKSVYAFYAEGFQRMKLGKTLWLLIALKLFVLFAIVKWLFFPDVLQEKFQTDQERSEYILQQLTKDKS